MSEPTDIQTGVAANVDRVVYPAYLRSVPRWMTWKMDNDRKIPRAPQHGGPELYASAMDEDNWMDFRKASEYVEMLPQLSGLTFTITDDDNLCLLDYDDVRNPETEEILPVVKEHIEEVNGFAQVSTSGTGVHMIVKGSLPNGVRSMNIDLEGHEDAELEVYPTSRFIAMTGELLEFATPVIRQAEGFLDGLYEEYGDKAKVTEKGKDGKNWEPETSKEEVEDTDATEDIGVLYDAIKHTTVRDIRLDSEHTEGSTGGRMSFDPSWEQSDSGTRLGYEDGGWIYRKGNVGLDALQVVALEEGIIRRVDEYPSGKEFWEAVEELRDRGAHIPEYEPSDDGWESNADPTPMLPLSRLDRLNHEDMHRYGKKRGLEWPEVEEVRQRLHDSITESIKAGDTTVKAAPTGAGKTYTVATEPWLSQPELTGEQPVIHLHETKEARDQAVADSEEAGVEYRVLKSGWERCPVARGDHDPENGLGNEIITIDGRPVSEWMYERYQKQGVGFSVIHDWVENKIEGDMPCEAGDTECPAKSQWNGIPKNDDGVCEVDIIHATHQFLHVPSMRMHTNVFVDEKPDFSMNVSHEQFVKSINAYLDWTGAPIDNYHDLVFAAKHGRDPNVEGQKKVGGVMRREHNATFCETLDQIFDGRTEMKECPHCDGVGHHRVQENTLTDEEPECHKCHGSGEVPVNSGKPSMDWYRDNPQVHSLAPAFTRAVWRSEESAAGRRRARIPYEPPRLDAHANDSSVWNRVMVDVVLDKDWNITTLAQTPDMTLARSIIGLDAHAAPEPPNWQIDLHPSIKTDPILTEEERTLYRRYERGLRTVQIGEGKQPMTTGKYLELTQGDKLRVITRQMREHYGEDFATAITAMAAEGKLTEWMKEAGIEEPRTMHYGEERGRNDFAGENIGLVAGTISPNDDAILDMLARQGWDAEPKMKQCPVCEGTGEVKTAHDHEHDHEVCETCGGDGEVREHGQEFVGEDADKADALLRSVREGHVAQSAGRWARNADDPEDTAIVFIMTECAPSGFIDKQTPGVTWTTNEEQRERLKFVRDNANGATVKEIAEEFGCSKQAAADTLKTAEEKGIVERTPGVGPYGADVWSPSDGFNPYGAADVSVDGSTRAAYRCTNTWTIAIRGSPDRAWNCAEEPARPWEHQSTFEWFEEVSGPPI